MITKNLENFKLSMEWPNQESWTQIAPRAALYDADATMAEPY